MISVVRKAELEKNDSIKNEDGTWHLLDKFDGGVSLFTLMSKINNCLV